ncbi:hypothetical protein KCV05_g193, partial [Aureobasidium melanogenum]
MSAVRTCCRTSVTVCICLICWLSAWTSCGLTGWTAGVRVERSKFVEDSGSRASMLIVRQLNSAMVGWLPRTTWGRGRAWALSVTLTRRKGVNKATSTLTFYTTCRACPASVA